MRYWIHQISNTDWQKLLAFYLAKADAFCVHFPDDPGELSFGKSEFLKLADSTTKPWRSNHSVEIPGQLTAEAVDLFITIETDFYASKKLWDYQLLENGKD